MKPIVLDFETFYDSDYTLKKLSTSAYIADPRFEVLSCSIYDLQANDLQFYRGHAEIYHALSRIDWNNAELIAQHTQFDALIMTHHFGFKPARYACTLAMARFWEQGACDGYSLDALAAHHKLLGKQGEAPKGKHVADLTPAEWETLKIYNDHDVKLTAWLYLYYSARVPQIERNLQSMTIRMFAEPHLRLDRSMLIEARIEAQERKDDVFSKLGIEPAILRSRTKFPKLLEELGVDPPRKISRRTGKETYAFSKKDEEFLALQQHPNEYVRDLVEAKLEASSNLSVTRAGRLITTHDLYGGLLPVYLKSSAARTHRWGGGDKTNLQALTRGSKLRKAIIAPPGYYIFAADQAQVEARMAAWLAGATPLVDAFAGERDVYSEFATEAFGIHTVKDRSAEDKLRRFVGKTCVLGLQYNAGAARLQHTLATDPQSPTRLDLVDCARFVDTYRALYYQIPNTWQWLNDTAIPWLCYGKGDLWLKDCVRFEGSARRVWLPNGTSLYYPGLDDNERTYVSQGDVITIYGGKLFENIDQALSRVKISEDMLAIDGPVSRVCGMSHDEIIGLTRIEDWPAEEARITQIMRASPPWAPGLPLNVEISVGERYEK